MNDNLGEYYIRTTYHEIFVNIVEENNWSSLDEDHIFSTADAFKSIVEELELNNLPEQGLAIIAVDSLLKNINWKKLASLFLK